MTANTASTATGAIPRQPHTIGDLPSGVGSPLAKHPGNCMPSGDFSFRSGFQSQLQAFQAHTQKTYDWYTKLKQLQSYVKRPSSRKQERQAQPKPLMETPTQSPLQKTGRLQSVVSVVQKEQPKRDRSAPRDPCDDGVPIRQHADGTFETAPYHLCGSPEVIAEQFVLYCTDRFRREEFQDEVEDFGNVFGHRTAFVARYCMVTAVYFEVAWVHGYRWIFPNIPPEMEKMTSRRGATLPASPKESVKCTGVDVLARCLKRWCYFLALMQFWKDETTPLQYSGIVRYDSKVMLYVMFRLKAVLKSVDFQFHHYAVKNTTTWGDYARRHLMSDQVTADRKAHQKTHDELTHMKIWMQHRYEDEADLELEILRRVRGDVDRLEVHRENRRRHPGNKDEYRHVRQKLEEEQNKGRGAQGAYDQERATRDQRRESESRKRQKYTREREEQIDFEQSEPYLLPISEPDPPTQPEPSSQGGAKPKTKLSLEDYRNRQRLEQSQLAEAKKVEQARLHELKIWQAEVARIEQEQEQLRLEQEHVRNEQEANAALLTSQAQQAPAALGSHTPCYDEHGQELDYHDDVPAATDSQECKNSSDYFRQQGDEYGVQLAESLDAEHDLLRGPTTTSTVSEEAVLLEETPTAELEEEMPTAELEEEMPTTELLEEETPTVDMGQFLAGLETLTPEMLSEVSTRIEHLRQLAASLASTKSAQTESPPPPPGLPATPTVPNPMEQALLKVTSNLGTSPACQRTPTCPPGAEETERVTALLVEQMAKAPGTPSRKQKRE